MFAQISGRLFAQHAVEYSKSSTLLCITLKFAFSIIGVQRGDL